MQSRLTRYKLGIRLGRADVLKRLLRSGQPGFYFPVALGDAVGPGDLIDWSREGMTA
jgi:hypothetical protein